MGPGPWARADVSYADGKFSFFRSSKCTPGWTVWVVTKKSPGANLAPKLAQIPIAKGTGAFSFKGMGAATKAINGVAKYKYGTVNPSGSFPTAETLKGSLPSTKEPCSGTGRVPHHDEGNVS